MLSNGNHLQSNASFNQISTSDNSDYDGLAWARKNSPCNSQPTQFYFWWSSGSRALVNTTGIFTLYCVAIRAGNSSSIYKLYHFHLCHQRQRITGLDSASVDKGTINSFSQFCWTVIAFNCDCMKLQKYLIKSWHI